AALFVIAWIAAHTREPVRREGNEVVGRKPPRDVLYVRIQPAVLVNHKHAGSLSGKLRWPREVSANRAIALRRLHGRVFRLDASVVLRDLLRPSIVGPKHLEERGRGEAVLRVALRAVQKFSALDVAVDILVKQVEQFLREITGFLPFHCEMSP